MIFDFKFFGVFQKIDILESFIFTLYTRNVFFKEVKRTPTPDPKLTKGLTFDDLFLSL